ncbi:helix-turn-helix domain-containing protein [Enterococcus sp. LJL90]
MKLNEVIFKRRKELQLTQEQVALALNVSAPAVSKWERGSSLPDITLLPGLARLLKIDLNTLFNFEEELSVIELGNFIEKLFYTLKDEGLLAGLTLAQEKIKEFTHDEKLILVATQQLEAEAIMQGDDASNKDIFKEISLLFGLLENSDNQNIRFSAQLAKVRNLIRFGDYNSANQALSQTENVHLDKTPTEIQLLRAEGNEQAALTKIESEIMRTASSLLSYLFSKFEIAIEKGLSKEMGYYGDLIIQTVENYHLSEVFVRLVNLMMAALERNADQFLGLLEKLIDQENWIWKPHQYHLYEHLTENEVNLAQMFYSQDLEKLFEPVDLNFLKDIPKFQELKEKWQSKMQENIAREI